MSSTEFNIGLAGDKSSSRVLKPPGGGHSNIFGEPEAQPAQPRPKYDQQNSSNMNFCMNTVNPNILVQQPKENVVESTPVADNNDRGPAQSAKPTNNITGPAQNDHGAQPKGCMPADNNGHSSAQSAHKPTNNITGPAQNDRPAQPKERVPPGGFSSGLW